jgi:hypothetical protein
MTLNLSLLIFNIKGWFCNLKIKDCIINQTILIDGFVTNKTIWKNSWTKYKFMIIFFLLKI